MDFNESLFPEFLNLTLGTCTSETPTELTMEKLDEAIRLAITKTPLIKEIIINENDYIKVTHLFRKSDMPDQYTTWYGIAFRTTKSLPQGTGTIRYMDDTFKFFNIN